MAPEIFEKKYRHAASLSVASTPFCMTPSRLAASTPTNPSTPNAQVRIELEQQKTNMHRDIWAFGCVLYELATHRRPWYQELELSTSSTYTEAEGPTMKPDESLFFLRRFWKNLGQFHGGNFLSTMSLSCSLLFRCRQRWFGIEVFQG